jgi:hypothetical protein
VAVFNLSGQFFFLVPRQMLSNLAYYDGWEVRADTSASEMAVFGTQHLLLVVLCQISLFIRCTGQFTNSVNESL